MQKKTFISIFAGAVACDLLVTPALGAPLWMPYISLALLPALFLFVPLTFALAIAGAQALLLWLTASINLGIAVFALGILLFIEQWFIPRFLHTTTWQSLTVAALGLPVSLFILMFLSTLLTPAAFTFGIRSITATTLTTLLALGILFIVRKQYA